MITIKEIAKESGYGVGTVSRVLNNSEHVSEKAKKAIMDVVKKYNFEPNPNAKNLKSQTKYGIVLIVKGTQNMLFESIVELMQTEIVKNGHACVVDYIDQDENEVEEARKVCNNQKPYGIAFLGSNLEYFEKNFEDLDLPCVIVTNGASELNISNLSSVAVDDVSASSRIVNYLYDKGHRNIGVIGGDPNVSHPSSLRLLGFESAMRKKHLEFDMTKQYSYARFSLEGGYQATKDLLKKNSDITAIFAMSDMMAMGALRALKDMDIKVPQDMSVIGYDGTDIANFCIPRITTVWQNTEKLAKRSVEILLGGIKAEEKGENYAVHEIVPYVIKEGSSVGEVKSKKK